MKRWDYDCLKCGHVWEESYTTLLERDQDEHNRKCPKCGSKKKERQFPKSGSFQLKGKWFKQGY